MRKGIPSVEPSVIFKLRPPVIPVIPLVACLAQEYFQPCLPGEVGIIEAFSYCRSCVKEPEPDCLNKAEISSPEIKNCVRDITPPPVIKERWVRSPPPPPYLRRASAIPPPPRTPKPIRRQSISLPTKQLTVLDIPTVFRPERSRTNRENPRTKIKFSTSTALYKPPDPVYEGVKTRRKPAF
ncbi:uncharacterized protein LOC111716096 [Eurytemora carolleeae]|uniref:uncharacterized protein LOC111716096 n=1 Tax=Eurytemora carolleeae TaxID=1294199 RepID=UPI000C79321F|nr:uncharacterized protein LOC111716096 [Eurytemora carolleeae]XP_023347278.1 uncharacterized protein LOC111716096 [Eurytemora carolleeae]|eukprot:XP_023347277.1 uncharacterized protein LOC111716096 [Eurytemora affinis]